MSLTVHSRPVAPLTPGDHAALAFHLREAQRHITLAHQIYSQRATTKTPIGDRLYRLWRTGNVLDTLLLALCDAWDDAFAARPRNPYRQEWPRNPASAP